jgi:hypothetical protein
VHSSTAADDGECLVQPSASGPLSRSSSGSTCVLRVAAKPKSTQAQCAVPALQQLARNILQPRVRLKVVQRLARDPLFAVAA